MAYVNISNPGNMHASTLTVGSITNGGCITGLSSPVTTPVTAAGISGMVNSTVTLNTSSNFNSHKVNINQDGIDMADGTDIKIGNQSLKEFMQAVNDRLAILVPDPAKLEKYEALKQAYEHYKLLEALIADD